MLVRFKLAIARGMARGERVKKQWRQFREVKPRRGFDQFQGRQRGKISLLPRFVWHINMPSEGRSTRSVALACHSSTYRPGRRCAARHRHEPAPHAHSPRPRETRRPRPRLSSASRVATQPWSCCFRSWRSRRTARGICASSWIQPRTRPGSWQPARSRPQRPRARAGRWGGAGRAGRERGRGGPRVAWSGQRRS
jgi:hypothetical protein